MLVTGLSDVEALELVHQPGRLPYESMCVQYENKKKSKVLVGTCQRLWLVTQGPNAGCVGSFLYNDTEDPSDETFCPFSEHPVLFSFGKWQQDSDKRICFVPFSWPCKVPPEVEPVSLMFRGILNEINDYKFVVNHKQKRVDIEEFPSFWMAITSDAKAAAAVSHVNAVKVSG